MMKWFLILFGAAGVALLILLAAWILRMVVDQNAKGRFDAELEKISDRFEVRYADLSYGWFRPKIRVSELVAETRDGVMRLFFETLTVTDWQRSEATEGITHLSLSGQAGRILYREEGGEWMPLIATSEASDPVWELNLVYEFEPGARVVTVKRFVLESIDLGSLSARGMFHDAAGLDWERLLKGNALQKLSAFGGLKVGDLELKYADDGLLLSKMAEEARKTGRSREEVAESIYEIVETQKTLKLTKAMKTAIRGFLLEPKEIVITANPAEPVGTMKLTRTLLFQRDLVRMFGLDVVN